MRGRWVSSLAAGALLVVALSGCTFNARIANLEPYHPSDGVGVTMGDVAVRNAMLIANNSGSATLVMTVVNRGDEDATVNFQYGPDGNRQTVSVDVPGMGSVVRVGDDPGTTVVLEDPSLVPGGLFEVYAEYGDVPGELMQVPVLDGTLPEYELYVP